MAKAQTGIARARSMHGVNAIDAVEMKMMRPHQQPSGGSASASSTRPKQKSSSKKIAALAIYPD